MYLLDYGAISFLDNVSMWYRKRGKRKILYIHSAFIFAKTNLENIHIF